MQLRGIYFRHSFSEVLATFFVVPPSKLQEWLVNSLLSVWMILSSISAWLHILCVWLCHQWLWCSLESRIAFLMSVVLSARNQSKDGSSDTWVKLFKDGPSKICGRQPLTYFPSSSLKAVFHKFYLVYSWILSHMNVAMILVFFPNTVNRYQEIV